MSGAGKGWAGQRPRGATAMDPGGSIPARAVPGDSSGPARGRRGSPPAAAPLPPVPYVFKARLLLSAGLRGPSTGAGDPAEVFHFRPRAAGRPGLGRDGARRDGARGWGRRRGWGWWRWSGRLGARLSGWGLPPHRALSPPMQPLLEEGETWKESRLVQQVSGEVRGEPSPRLGRAVPRPPRPGSPPAPFPAGST